MPFHRIGGVDLYSEETGEGETVLLLHGGFCSLESLRPQGQALAADHRVIAFERPGHGRSADIDEEYSYARGLSETLGYLDAVATAPVHVIGYSDGAILGLMLAMEHPQRVRSLVTISANIDPTGFSHVPEAAEHPMLSALPDREREDVEQAHYERLSPDGPAHSERVLEKLIRLWTAEPRIPAADLARIAAPTLVIGADHDTIRVDHSLLIAASIPGAELAIVPGASHGLVNERPELLRVLIRDFLDRVED
ncbi:alpha/beta fold hydrolase [Microbacterium sp. NPDC055903]